MTTSTVDVALLPSTIESRERLRLIEIGKEEIPSDPYARCIAASQRVRWDLEKDVIRGRTFDREHKFLPNGLSKVHELEFLTPNEQRYLSQIQGRTYANLFHMAERFVNAKILEISRDHWLGNQVALEALIRFSDEELKHQKLFRRLDQLADEQMASGYRFIPDSNEVADVVLSKGTWAVLALTYYLELTSQWHYRQSMEADEALSPLFKDVFRFHWLEESQHALLDELEWKRHDQSLSGKAKDQAVAEFLELVRAVDGILQMQAQADADYLIRTCGRKLLVNQHQVIEKGILKAYRWQFILSGIDHPHFMTVLTRLISEKQRAKILEAMGEFC